MKFLQQGIKDIGHPTKRAVIFKAEAKKLSAKVNGESQFTRLQVERKVAENGGIFCCPLGHQ